MSKTILITGATAGIGELAAHTLHRQGHRVVLHGRSADKLAAVAKALGGDVPTFRADLADPPAVAALADQVAEAHPDLDVLINNAGVFKTRAPRAASGHDVRFLVNTLAPYLLARRLAPTLGAAGRVVNLSSAAQQPVDLQALSHGAPLADFAAYAQSKLALTMWSCWLGRQGGGPMQVAVNPASMLGTRMVREGFGVAGKPAQIGADVLVQAATGEAFADATGRYFDNDAGRFAAPHPDALDDAKCAALVHALDALAAAWSLAPTPT